MERFTPEECVTIRAALVEVLTVVAKADQPGIIGWLKEERATRKALQGLREPLLSIVMDADAAAAEYDHPECGTATGYLKPALAAIEAKAPELVEPFKVAVLKSTQAVAAAARGVNLDEQEILVEIRTFFGDNFDLLAT